jgi:hypothetical protein
MPEPKLYGFSTAIATACKKQSRTFADLLSFEDRLVG